MRRGGADRNNAIEAIRASYDSGVTSIDTAPAYGQGASEEIVGEAIKGLPREKLQVLTKYGLRWNSTKGSFYFKSKDNNGRDIDIHKYAGKESIIKECEESLRRMNIPYTIYGGISFYQRKEIKDIVAYLRLLVNTKDEEALKRIEKDAYGTCELTGKPIPRARLDAIPWTRFTVEAQAQLEREGALRQKRLGALGTIDSAGAAETEDDDEVEEKPAREKE
jgi:hypothetical protein